MVTRSNSNPKAANSEPLGRRERKRLETLEKLFQSALQLFAKNGFAATRVEEITEAADVAKGTFFNYFPSKEHVLTYFAGRQIGTIDRYLEKAREGRQRIEPLVKEMAHALVALPGKTPEMARSLMAAFVSNEEVRKVLREEIAGKGRRILAEIFAIGQERGELRRDLKPLQMAKVFQQNMFGTVLLWSLNPVEPLGDAIDEMIDVCSRGIGAEPVSRKKVMK